LFYITKSLILDTNRQYSLIDSDLKPIENTTETYTRAQHNITKTINEIEKTFIKIQEEYLNRSFFYYDNPDILNKHKNEFFNDTKMKYVNKWIDDNKFKLIEDKL
jgi:hypothetical protein